MSVRRLPDPSRRSRRLVVCGVTAALLVVPGVAHADGPALPDPMGGAATQLQDAIGNVLPIPAVTIPAVGGTTTDGTPGAGATPTFTPPDLGPLQALFDALGVPEQCTTAITGDLVEIVSSIPATVQAIVTQLQAALEAVQEDPTSLPDVFQAQIMTLLGGLGGAPGADADEDGVPLITAVEGLVADFLANCLPKPQTTAPTSLAPAAQQTTPPPAAPLPTAPAAPVAYLGYAPTGVDTDDSADSTPLLAVAGVLLLGGGVAGTWMRLRRGVSSRG